VVAATVIDSRGDANDPHRGFHFHYGEDLDSVVSGLTITNGFGLAGGGGIFCQYASPTISRNIITENTADGDGSEIGLITGATLTVSYSDVRPDQSAFYIEGGCVLNLAEGNIEEDPCFVEPGYWNLNGTPENANDDFWVDGDYHLKSEGWRWDEGYNPPWRYDDVTGRCIDSGNPGSPLGDEPVTLAVDPLNQFGRNLRINMGAYGGTDEASMPPYDWALRADLTNDGVVDFEDFAGQESSRLESEQRGDLNRNGAIDMSDVALLTEEWLRQTSWCEP